ncbi:ornithine aminomutase subunit alpha [Pelosinus propionicus]|uniref:D-ornithine 4,5-aminomutase S subunit n=1 Tax=Pelosinus propionicus DSM 13327 TaxID=1123291 RepID=A0A1I4JMI7_9FIRM|nr:ornithine aminomutase subunit alpha [Pelosinus propionicus]SFL67501.1 D-ornithine 4,5-aminomutase S subunit [Pelosinus propionicus DSM 13327]
MHRDDDYLQRRAHLAPLTEEELKERFWGLAKQLVEPLVELAHTHTSPSVERSVLLRMGFSSIEAKEIVQHCEEQGLLGKGAGHAVWRLAALDQIDYREAGLQLGKGQGWEKLVKFWAKGEQNDIEA